MSAFDMQMNVGTNNTYELFTNNQDGILQIAKFKISPLKAFISLNAGKKSNEDVHCSSMRAIPT